MFAWRKIAVACVFATIFVALAIEALSMAVTGQSFVATAFTVIGFALVIEVFLLFILIRLCWTSCTKRKGFPRSLNN